MLSMEESSSSSSLETRERGPPDDEEESGSWWLPLEIVVERIFEFVSTEDLRSARETCGAGAEAAEDIAKSRLSTLASTLASKEGKYFRMALNLSRLGNRALALASRNLWLLVDASERQERVEALKQAVRLDDATAVRDLVARGVDLDFRVGTFLPATHAAAFDGRVRALDALLACGATVHQIADGYLPLGLASAYGRKDAVRVILQHHPEVVNLKNTNGFSALIAAVVANEASVCKLLIDHGADVRCRTPNGLDALTLARRRNRSDICNLVLATNAFSPSVVP